jgi:hypothetical protein
MIATPRAFVIVAHIANQHQLAVPEHPVKPRAGRTGRIAALKLAAR